MPPSQPPAKSPFDVVNRWIGSLTLLDEESPRKRVVVNILAGVIALAIFVSCCLEARHKLFWSDEIATYYFVADRSFAHMMDSLINAPINTTPPLYFTVCWIWARLFGYSAISLRLFSCLSFEIGFFVLYLGLRKWIGSFSALFGATCAILLFPSVAHQVAEARYYGFFFALAALATIQYLKVSSEPRPTLRALAIFALLIGCMVMVHAFAFLYSAAFLVGFLVQDIVKWHSLRKVERWWLARYASVFVGWLVYIPWIGPSRNYAALLKPYTWIPMPHLNDLLTSYFGFANQNASSTLLIVRVLLVGILLMGALSRSPRPSKNGNVVMLVGMATAFLLLPTTLIFVYSHLRYVIFLDRYFVPGVIGWAILLGLLLRWRSGADSRIYDGGKTLMALGILVLIVIKPLVHNLRSHTDVRFTEQFETIPGATDLPIVCESSHDYDIATFYSSQRRRFIYLMDQEAALAPGNAREVLTQYRTYVAYARHYPHDTALDWQAFLSAHPRFLYYHHDGFNWLDYRIYNNPRYRVTRLLPGESPGDALYLIERKAP